MAAPDHTLAHELVELRAQLASQAAAIERLEAALAATTATASSDPAPDGTDAEPASTLQRVTDRRSLLRHAGLATAGALGGAAVLAQAAPAAAAQGTFDGNPGVIGTANPTTGVGVRGDTATGTGVLGRSTSTTGAAVGVQGTVASPDAIGVSAINTATTGSPTAMQGITPAVDGIAVLGDATSTAIAAVNEDAVGVKGIARSTRGSGVFGIAPNTGGATIGVRAQCFSADGFAVNAFNGSTATGDGLAVRAATNAVGGIALLAVCNSLSGSTVAVRATATNSATGTAMRADGARTGVLVSADGVAGSAVEIGSSRTALRFTSPNPPPLTNPSPGTYAVGDIVFDTAGDLWICATAGTPGSFRRLGGATTAGSLVLLNTPVRVSDSRPGEIPLNSTKGPITGNTTRVIDMKNNSSGVPTGASGVLCTLTVVNTSANGGFLALFKNGAATPATSTVNWTTANQVVGTTTVTAVDATAQAKVFCPPNSSTNFFIDVIGFYQ